MFFKIRFCLASYIFFLSTNLLAANWETAFQYDSGLGYGSNAWSSGISESGDHYIANWVVNLKESTKSKWTTMKAAKGSLTYQIVDSFEYEDGSTNVALEFSSIESGPVYVSGRSVGKDEVVRWITRESKDGVQWATAIDGAKDFGLYSSTGRGVIEVNKNPLALGYGRANKESLRQLFLAKQSRDGKWKIISKVCDGVKIDCRAGLILKKEEKIFLTVFQTENDKSWLSINESNDGGTTWMQISKIEDASFGVGAETFELGLKGELLVTAYFMTPDNVSVGSKLLVSYDDGKSWMTRDEFFPKDGSNIYGRVLQSPSGQVFIAMNADFDGIRNWVVRRAESLEKPFSISDLYHGPLQNGGGALGLSLNYDQDVLVTGWTRTIINADSSQGSLIVRRFIE